MSEFRQSNLFGKANFTYQSVLKLSELDILKDVVRTLQDSKYQNKYFLRGGFVLMSMLEDRRRREYERKTTDIDMDFISKDCWEEFVSEVAGLLTSGSKLGAIYILTRRRGFEKNPTSDSLSFKAERNGIIVPFKIDMNIRKFGKLSTYTTLDFVVNGTDMLEMLCDKLAVLSQRTVCRRIKDLYDVYVLAHVCDFTMLEFAEVWFTIPRTLGEPIYILDMTVTSEIAHAYDKFMGIVNKPKFEQVYQDALKFSLPIFEVISGVSDNVDMLWNHHALMWGVI